MTSMIRSQGVANRTEVRRKSSLVVRPESPMLTSEKEYHEYPWTPTLETNKQRKSVRFNHEDPEHISPESPGAYSDSGMQDGDGEMTENDDSGDDDDNSNDHNISGRIFEQALVKDIQVNEELQGRVREELGKKTTSESLLHKLMHNTKILSSKSESKPLVNLTIFIVQQKPELLADVSKQEGKTPLHLALEKCVRKEHRDAMVGIIKSMCDASEDIVKDGPNYCRKAIDTRIDNLTCLHYAISKKVWDILDYLVPKADPSTFMTCCGEEENTVLHEALRNVKHLHSDLIAKIIERNPDALLKVNKQGLSPYRFFLEQKVTKQHNLDGFYSQELKSQTDRSKTRPGSKADEVNGKLAALSDLRDKHQANEKDKKFQKQQKRFAGIDTMLRDKCLDRGSFHNALKALYGNMEGNQGTWLNLLCIELPEDFAEKLEFRKLDRQMVFVGLRVPETAITSSADLKEHIVIRFFRWLQDKQVKQILKVVIKGNHSNSCGDEVIESALKPFNVHYLDWDRTDLSSRTIRTACANIRELTLYCGGNRAVIDGWEDQNGLRGLEKLITVTIYVSKGLDTSNRVRRNLDSLKKTFEDEKSGKRSLAYHFMSSRGGNGNDSKNTAMPLSSAKIHNWFRLVEGFLEGIGETDGPLKDKPSPKVCLIDDGIDLTEDCAIDIEGGRSFGQMFNFSSNPGECFPSTNGHGTSMAKIIHKICPRVRLYVAKLEGAGGRGSFTMKDATKAIEWAIRENVDIISMSWTIDDGSDDDIKALTNAIPKQSSGRSLPLMFCASRDQGKEVELKPVYPHSCAPHAIIRIGAVDEYGGTLSFTPREVDYLLPCQGLDMSTMDDLRKVTEGSSEATALASGLAALVLFTEGVIYDQKGIDFMRHLPRMSIIFDEMTRAKLNEPKFISPYIFDDAVKKTGMTKNSSVTGRCSKLSDRCHAFLKSRGETCPYLDSRQIQN